MRLRIRHPQLIRDLERNANKQLKILPGQEVASSVGYLGKNRRGGNIRIIK